MVKFKELILLKHNISLNLFKDYYDSNKNLKEMCFVRINKMVLKFLWELVKIKK